MTHALIVNEADLALLKLLGRHPALQRALERAIVVPAAGIPPDVVTLNSRVAYVDETAGVRTTVKLVYPRGAAARGHLPVTSPLGTRCSDCARDRRSNSVSLSAAVAACA